jgi:hypothetical protein
VVTTDDATLKRQWGCRDFADLAVRCGKVAPSTELPPNDVKFLGVLETCCVIKSENAHVIHDPLKVSEYVPVFCKNTSAIREHDTATIDDLVFRLSHATKDDGGRDSWQRTWRAQNILLQQACDPVAMHMVMKNAVDLLTKQEAVIDFVELLWTPFKTTKQWALPPGKRDAILMLQEVLMSIPAINLMFGFADNASLIIFGLLVCSFGMHAFLGSRPSPMEIAVSGLVLVIRYAIADWLKFSFALLLTLCLIAMRHVFATGRKRSRPSAAVAATAEPATALELIRTIFYGSLLDSNVLAFCQELVEFVLSSRATQRGTLPWLYNNAVRVATKQDVPDRTRDILIHHQRDAESIAQRVKSSRRG